tara:strand:+ start:1385 stop:1624 length:240 start_codon:yes stop_codon:yes gene_type:complete
MFFIVYLSLLVFSNEQNRHITPQKRDATKNANALSSPAKLIYLSILYVTVINAITKDAIAIKRYFKSSVTFIVFVFNYS